MSKHEKQVRRERKKTDRARRRGSLSLKPQASSLRPAAAALAAAAVIAAGTQAYASPVRFDNPAGPGHFVWGVDGVNDYTFLDITEGQGSQGGGIGLTSWAHNPVIAGGYVTSYSAGPEIATYYGLLISFDPGHLITAAGGGPYYWYGYGNNVANYLPAGTPTYLAARFDPGDGWHTAWMGVERTGQVLDLFAWGYETTPGVPIEAGVPEPNTLALLAFGAVAAIRKRRPA